MLRCFLLTLMLSALPALTFASAILANEYGARGDAKTLNTQAIQRAIDTAAQQHGAVSFAPGVYLTGSIFVKSGVTLHVNKGVTLLGSQNLADYPVMPTRVAGIEMPWPAALINVYEQNDVRIEGEGTIDGNGKIFWDSYRALRKAYEPRGLRWASDYDARRPRLIQIFNSDHVNLGSGRFSAGPASGRCTSATRMTSP